MRKTLVLIVVAILFASAVFSAGPGDFVHSYFSYSELSMRQVLADFFNFFRGAITGLAGFDGELIIAQASECLNISNLTSDYYMNESRVVCSGTHVANSKIVIEDISSITLDCNGSVLVKGTISDELLKLENATNILIKNCTFENFNKAIYGGYIENLTVTASGFRNISNDAILIADKSRQVRVSGCSFNGFGGTAISSPQTNNSVIEDCTFTNPNPASGATGVNLCWAGLCFNNSAKNLFFENITHSLVVSNNENFIADGITAKNASYVCVADVLSNNSVYTNLNLSGCFYGFGLALTLPSTIATGKFTLENSTITNSNFSLAFLNAFPENGSSVKNVKVANSEALIYLENSTIRHDYLDISELSASNVSTGIYAVKSAAQLLSKPLNVTSMTAYLSGNSSVEFINVSFNKSLPITVLDSSTFTAGWLFNVLVMDELFNPVSSANVTLYNSSGIVFSELTNASGNIQWKNVTEYTLKPSIPPLYQNYSILATSPFGAVADDPAINESKMLPIVFLGNASLHITSPISGFYYNTSLISLNYTVLFENPDSCWFTNVTGSRINLENCANTTFTALEGLNNITLFANDSSGNLSFSRIFFTVDTVFPNITFFGISLVTNTSVNISWKTSEETNMSFVYYRKSMSDTGHNSTFADQNSYILTGLDVHTYYSINTTFCDRAGNCVLNASSFQSGYGNFTPQTAHVPEKEIVIQELVLQELSPVPERKSLTPGSRHMFLIDGEQHEVKLKLVYTDKRVIFEFKSEPVLKEVAKGGTVRVDLTGDGVEDVELTVQDIELTRVTFDIRRIFLRQEVVEEEKEEPPLVQEPSPPEERIVEIIVEEESFIGKYGIFIIIALAAVIAATAGGGAVLLRKGKLMPAGKEAQKEAEKLHVPKTSHLEGIMKAVYAMLDEKKTEIDVSKYLEGLNLEENVIKSILFEMKSKNNRIDQLIYFTKKQFSQGKSVEEVRRLLAENDWANNIIILATEE